MTGVCVSCAFYASSSCLSAFYSPCAVLSPQSINEGKHCLSEPSTTDVGGHITFRFTWPVAHSSGAWSIHIWHIL